MILEPEIHWINDCYNKRKIQYIDGLLDGYKGMFEGHNSKRIAIDAGIASLIYKLNRRGYTTCFHCSGLKKDHKFNNYKYIGWEEEINYYINEGYSLKTARRKIREQEMQPYGYISFVGNPKEVIRLLPIELEYTRGIYFKNNYKVAPDEVKESIWEEFYNRICS